MALSLDWTPVVAKATGIRLLLIGDAGQVHLKRWHDYFVSAGYDTLTLSLESPRGFRNAVLQPPVPRFLPGFLRYPLAVPFVRKVIRSYRPDLVNAHFLPNYGMIAALAGKKPWILSAWGSDIMLLPEKSFFHMWRTRFVLRRASFMTSDARVMTSRLLELGCDPGRIVTVPYGVETAIFNDRGRVDSEKGPRILSNRKLERVYNIETVIEAFPLIEEVLPDASLLILGSGSMAGALEARARRLACRGISFSNQVDHEKVPDLLRSSDIFVSMALSDTTSVSLLEAMACGAFPIVSDIPANREWVRDGENGLLVQPRDPGALARAVREAWGNADLRERARRMNATIIRERAEWRANMKKVEALFERAVQEKTG